MRRETSPRTETTRRPRGLRHAIPLALGAAGLYGCWAFHANLGSGPSAALRAALTQACLSFTATLVQVALLEALFQVGRTPLEGFGAAAIGGSVIGVSLAATAHLLAGTPHVVATMTPTTLVGVLFNVVYARQLLAAATRGSVPACAGA